MPPFALPLVIAAALPAPDPALFAYDASRPLALRAQEVERAERWVVHELVCDSPRGGDVRALLVAPPEPGKYAGLVLLHGAPGDRRDLLGYAKRLVQTGAVVVLPDAAFARRDGDPLTFTPRDRDEQVQTIVDLRRAVDVLQARPDVDPERIGFLGYSYGASVGALFAGVEPRLRAVALTHGGPGVATRPANIDVTLRTLPEAQVNTWLAAMWPVDASLYGRRPSNAAVLLQNGRRDGVVPPADAERLHANVADPKDVRWYDVEHNVTREMQFDAIDFFARTLGTRSIRF